MAGLTWILTDRQAGCGGLLRDENGNWIVGFVAELWGILYGLELAWKHGYRKVIIEADLWLLFPLSKKLFGKQEI